MKSAHRLLDQLKERARFVDGHKVVSDIDAAAAYGVSVARLRGSVTRNRARFPAGTLFDLSKKNARSYAFSDEGVLLLSGILRSPQADYVSVDMIRELFGFKSN